MNNQYFVGVDGGGTSCRARLEDGQGKLLGEGFSGSANVFQQPEKTIVSIIAAVDQSLKSAGLAKSTKQFIHAGIGLAGAEFDKSITFLEHWQHPFASMKFHNDAYVACLGAHAGNDGALMIIGTGVKGWLNYEGKQLQWSGYGFPLDDKGGGAWLGLRLVQQSLYSIDGIFPSSKLTKEVLERFDNDGKKIVSWSANASSADYGSFAKLVVEGYHSNDPIAELIVAEQKLHIEKILQAILEKMDDGLGLALLGGLAPFVSSILQNDLSTRLQKPKLDAKKGAILMIRNHILKSA